MTEELELHALADIEDVQGSLAQRVYLLLREAILNMTLEPGAVIKIAGVAAQLGVSRQPVSEAIARLSAEGLVEVVPQSATRVARFSMADLREAVFLRQALELAAVEHLARDHTPDQIIRLNRSIRMQELLLEDGDYKEHCQSDVDFHGLLMELTGFPGAVNTLASISARLQRARIALPPEPGRPVAVVAEHKVIVEAIASSDVETARNAMRLHLAQLIKRIEPLEGQRPELFRS